jgi:hypothetical protein
MLASAMHASFRQLPGAVSLARHFFTASIPLSFPSLIVWGANTGVGKTLVSAGLAAAAARSRVHLLYLKPVQTGFPTDSDAVLFARVHGHCHLLHGPHAAALVSSHAPTSTHHSAAADEASRLAAAKTLFAWNAPISPHVAVEREGWLVGWLVGWVEGYPLPVIANALFVLTTHSVHKRSSLAVQDVW